MKALPNDIVLRPRFNVQTRQPKSTVQRIFDTAQKSPFLMKRLDDHIFIRFSKEHTTFWSPQLHLELTDFEEGKTKIHGVYGPNPVLWTFFMFLHFGVATCFVILGIWAYSKHSLGHDITLLIVGMVLLVVVWIALYLFGRLGKAKGKGQMEQLHQFFNECLRSVNKGQEL
ncbi:hypothetical protein [Flagellimonas lutaonensis]|uniref:GTP-binding protein n=1 Tax=Flagellimonas lutaonensis TaxID=516051 RepID=A0A0D5YRT4_9FLAO|nr:hypothetical protein [Allomuricauda lutaonensis]AKA34556.1 hypothetical protein VC82_906 [Allomuricauda lutaonensis]